MIVDYDTIVSSGPPTSGNYFATSTDAIDLYPGRVAANGDTPGLFGSGEPVHFMFEVTTSFVSASDGILNFGILLSDQPTNPSAGGAENVVMTVAAPFVQFDGAVSIKAGFLPIQLVDSPTPSRFFMTMGRFTQTMKPGQDPRNLRFVYLIVINQSNNLTTQAYSAGEIQMQVVHTPSYEMNDRIYGSGFQV